MKKMLVLSLALSVFAVGSVFANDSVADVARGPRKVNVNLVLGTPPPPPASHCCGHHHKPEPPKHNCRPGNHHFDGKCDHHFDGPRPKPGNGRPAVRPGNNNGHRPPVGGRPDGSHRNEPPKGGYHR